MMFNERIIQLCEDRQIPQRKLAAVMDFYNIQSITTKAFGNNIELLSSVDELFELEMAWLEFNCLSKEQLWERSAFIKSIDEQFTKHFLFYSNYSEKINENRTVATQAYFEEGQFSTSYATYGLFPYRGKFHPQLIKIYRND